MNPIDFIGTLLGYIANPIADFCKGLAPEFFAHMGNDFSSWLLILSVSTGLIYCADRLFLESRRLVSGGAAAKPNAVVDFGRQFFPVILAVFMLRSFLVEPFRIPSGSMIPTLRVGDFILVNRFAYGLRCPVGNCTIIDTASPKHGDVVVFRYPVDPRMDFIKRVIGLPGDTIRYTNKTLTVNGQLAELQPQGNFENTPVQLYNENYFGVQHQTLQNPERPAQDFEFTVPAGQYFMMGDNRDGSSDSRFWGTVPASHLKGRAFFVWMSWDSSAESFAKRLVTSRIGHSIH